DVAVVGGGKPLVVDPPANLADLLLELIDVVHESPCFAGEVLGVLFVTETRWHGADNLNHKDTKARRMQILVSRRGAEIAKRALLYFAVLAPWRETNS